MSSCNTGDHIAEDNIHVDEARCYIKEPQQRCRLGTVSNILLGGGGGLNMFYWIQISPSASAIVQPNQVKQTNIKHLTSIFTYILFSLPHVKGSKVVSKEISYKGGHSANYGSGLEILHVIQILYRFVGEFVGLVDMSLVGPVWVHLL